MEGQFIEEAKQVVVSPTPDWITIMTLIASIVAAVGAVAAVVVAILIARAQKRIALLETRLQILKSMEDFVDIYFSDWDTCKRKSPIKNLSSDQIRILFDDELAKFFDRIIADFNKKNELIGDEEHAERKGECRGKEPQQIEDEIRALDDSLSKDFKVQKERAYKKWIKA